MYPTQFPLLSTTDISMVRLSQLMNRYEYNVINQSLDLFRFP